MNIQKSILPPALTQFHNRFVQSRIITKQAQADRKIVKHPAFTPLPLFCQRENRALYLLYFLLLSITFSPLQIGSASQPQLMGTTSELRLTNLNSSPPERALAGPVHSGIHLIRLCISLVDMRRRKWCLLG